MSTSQYDAFPNEVQEDILRLTLKDPMFSHVASRWVKPHYFTEEHYQWVSLVSQEFYSSYMVPPTEVQLETELKLHASTRKIEGDVANKVKSLLNRLYNKPFSGVKEHTLQHIQNFARHRGWEHAIEASLPYLEAQDFGKIDEIMKEAMGLACEIDSGGYWFFEALQERTRRRGTEEDKKIFPIGVLELDILLRRGGLVAGEVGMILAPKGKGKSIFLGQVARRAIFEGGKVAIYSFEMGVDQYSDRMDSGFTGVEMWDLSKEREEFLDKMNIIAARFPRSLMLKEFPTKGRTIGDIRQHLETLRQIEGWVPDMVVVDYIGIVKPSRPRDSRHLEMQENLEEFRGMCGELGCVGWTAGQINRSGAKKETADGTDAAGSWDQLATADYIFVVNQNRKQRIAGEIYLYIDKARDGIDTVIVGPLRSEFAKMCFAHRTDRTPDEIKLEMARARELALKKEEEREGKED